MANPYKEQQAKAKNADLNERCQALIAQGKRVEAIKAYRVATGASLPAARQALKM